MFGRMKRDGGDGLRLTRKQAGSDLAGRVFEHLQSRCLSSGLGDVEWMQSLTPAQRAVYSVGTVERAVQGEGWDGYFWNDSGDSYPEAVEGARLLGSEAWLTLLRDAGEAFPGGYSRDIDERQSALEGLDDEEKERRFAPLDERLYALDLDGATPLDGLLVVLIEKHAGDFFTDG